MKTYWRLLRYLRPYRGKLALSILFSVIFSIFSGLSIYLTIPLLETLFQGEPAASSAPQVSAVPSLLPGWLAGLKEGLTAAFQQLVFRPDPRDSLLNLCLVILFAFFAKNLFSYLQSNLMTVVEQSVVRDLRDNLYRHIHELPLGYFSNERTGNLISRVMNDVNVVNSGISATFNTLIREPLLLIVYLAICLILSW